MAHAGKTRRPFVLAAIVMAMFMAAIEGTIVATSMPSIVARLGGVHLYSWVFSAFLLMQAVTVPIYGKLSDLFGRKRVFIVGILIFLAGSVLCGFAWSMPSLVAFRFLQGFGAGAVQPLAITLVGDLYAIEERGRTQGYIASVWGLSSIVGPLAGALIVQHLQWSWIFWLHVPFGLLCIALVTRYLHEDVARKERSIDYAGAVLLLITVSALMLALTHGGDWGAAELAGLGATTLVAGALFYAQQRRAADPIMHLELWSNRLIARANLATLTAGMAMIGLISFLPTFVQGVLGGSALVAGFALCAMSIGWPIASVITGHVIVRVGPRRLARFGGSALLLGSVAVALFASSGPVAAGLGSLVVGIGLGTLNTTFIVSIQTSVAWAQRGAATGTNMLMRILGSALGAAIFGGVLNVSMQRYLAARGVSDSVSLDSIQGLLAGGANAAMSSAVMPAALSGLLQQGLSSSLHLVFWGVALAGAVTLAVVFGMPAVRLGPAAAKPPLR
ncbi:MAG: MFS transporter [Betaproteobacteria bacterium]|nr:MFS transporter [Betaproteobacteria bacterium]